MSSASITPTHVAISLRKLVGHHFCVGSRAGDGNSRFLNCGSALLNKREILPAFQSTAVSTPLSGVVASFSWGA